jgi:beta-galactosidase
MVPDACSLLTFQLEGEGSILGVGNGDPSYAGTDHPTESNCKTFSIPAFNGLAQVIVQSTRQTGSMKLTCTGGNLMPGTLGIVSQNRNK